MAIFDRKFLHNRLRYVLQSLLAGVSVLLVLAILDPLSNAAVIAALGASYFIAFTMPHAQVSKPRFLIGGYVVGVSAGTACYWLSQLAWPGPLAPLQHHAYVVFAALAVALAIFVMVVTNTEHPPAASLALGLVLGEWQTMTVVVVLAGIVAVCCLKRILKPILINLL